MASLVLVRGRLSPLGGAQGEEYWIKVKSKTILGQGSRGSCFWWIRKGLEGISLLWAEYLILLKSHLLKNFTWQETDPVLTLTWKNYPDLAKLNKPPGQNLWVKNNSQKATYSQWHFSLKVCDSVNICLCERVCVRRVEQLWNRHKPTTSPHYLLLHSSGIWPMSQIFIIFLVTISNWVCKYYLHL